MNEESDIELPFKFYPLEKHTVSYIDDNEIKLYNNGWGKTKEEITHINYDGELFEQKWYHHRQNMWDQLYRCLKDVLIRDIRQIILDMWDDLDFSDYIEEEIKKHREINKISIYDYLSKNGTIIKSGDYRDKTVEDLSKNEMLYLNKNFKHFKKINKEYFYFNYTYTWDIYRLTCLSINCEDVFMITNTETDDVVQHLFANGSLHTGDHRTVLIERDGNILIINDGDVWSAIYIRILIFRTQPCTFYTSFGTYNITICNEEDEEKDNWGDYIIKKLDPEAIYDIIKNIKLFKNPKYNLPPEIEWDDKEKAMEYCQTFISSGKYLDVWTIEPKRKMVEEDGELLKSDKIDNLFLKIEVDGIHNDFKLEYCLHPVKKN